MEHYDHVISTLPLSVLARCIPDVPAPILDAASRLTARSTVLVYLDIRGSQCFPELWRFVYDARYRMGRVAKRLPLVAGRLETTGATGSDRALCRVLVHTCDDATWAEPDDTVASVCELELRASGLLPADARVDAHQIRRVANTHPVPAVDSIPAVRKLRDYFANVAMLDVVGRHAVHGTSDVADNLQAGAESARTVMDALRRS